MFTADALLLTYEKLFPTFFQAIGGNWFSLSLDKKEYSQIRLHEICAPSTGVVLPKMAHVTWPLTCDGDK